MALESNIYALWASKQSAKGTLATAAAKRMIQVAGDADVQRADGSEAFSDLEQFGNMQDFVNTIVGQGAPGMEGQSDILAYMCFLFFGEDTLVAGTEAVQTIASAAVTTSFTITVGFGQLLQTTAAIPIAATGAEIKTALELLTVVKASGGIKSVTGGAPITTTPIVVTFNNATLGNAKMVVTPLAGATPAVTLTTPGTYAKHTFVPRLAGGLWTTWWKRVGATSVIRQKFGDGRMASMTIEGSTTQKVVRVTPTIIFLQPGILFGGGSGAGEEENATPGLKATPVNLINDPFMYTEGSGKYVIDGIVFKGQTQFNITWDYGLTPVYGDDVVPYDLQNGLAKITLATTLILDALSLEQYNRIIYGASTPALGTAPVKTNPPLGSYEVTLVKESVPGNVTQREEFKVVIPAVKWAPGLSIAPNAQGGAIDLPLAGEMRRNQGQAASTVTILNPDNAAY